MCALIRSTLVRRSILSITLISPLPPVLQAADRPTPPAAAAPNLAELADDPVKFLEVARKALKWDEPAEPAKIVGPIYFVGTQGLSVFLITTPDGHIVLNTGMPGSGPLIAASIRKLGFDPKEIKLLLIGHAHCDHVGGHAYLHELSGAKIVALKEEQELMESGGKADFHYGSYSEFGFDAAAVEQVVSDGDTIELGGLTLTALLTNGHTKGSASYVMDFVENGRTYSVAFPNGTSVNPGYRLVNDPSYPGIKEDFESTFSTLASLRPDIWLMPHNEAYGLFERLERAKTEGIRAWLDRDGYKQWVAAQRARFDAAVANESQPADPAPENQGTLKE